MLQAAASRGTGLLQRLVLLPSSSLGSLWQLQAVHCGPLRRVLVQPVFKSSMLLLQALVLEAEERMEGHGETLGREAAFFEVTIASVDQPKLLSRLSEALVRAGDESGWLGCAGLDVLLGRRGMALLSCRADFNWLRRWAVQLCSC